MNQDTKYMAAALRKAEKALAQQEVPVGAIIVLKDKVIGAGYNMCEQLSDATAHAEIMAIRDASKKISNWRLNGSTLYVTLEPCTMCLGAIIQSRINRVVYGAKDPKAGACGSLYNLAAPHLVENELTVEGGILKENCLNILQTFFKNRRALA